MNMRTTDDPTRQREICAHTEAQRQCTAEAEGRGLHSLWGELWIVRLSGSSSCIEYKLPFHSRPRACSRAGVKSSLFHVQSDWCGGHTLTAGIWGNIPDSPCCSSSHKPPLVLGNYAEGVCGWRKVNTFRYLKYFSGKKAADAYPAIKGNFWSDYCLPTGVFHYNPILRWLRLDCKNSVGENLAYQSTPFG